jgi:DNA-binding GntR family transcriptional regulator
MGRETLFGPIRSQKTLKDTAARLLTEKILSGKIRPGERLNESQLSRQLRISRAPIREALQQLLEQGIVVNVTRRGMFVVSLEHEDIQKINSLRLILEAEALRLARRLANPADLQKVARLVEKMENMEPAPTSDSVRIDIEFHRTIWSLAGNDYLERMLTSLTAPLFAHAMLTFLRAEKQRMVLDSHRPLLEFLQGKSKKSAEEVMLTHLSLRWTDPAYFSTFASSHDSSHNRRSEAGTSPAFR